MALLFKKRYIFNFETRCYELKRVPVSTHIYKLTALFLLSLVVSFGYYALYASYLHLESPKMMRLKQEQRRLKADLELLDMRFAVFEKELDVLEARDNGVYRTIFGMEQIPPQTRNAGFGGTDSYAYLDHSDNKLFLNKLVEHCDVVVKKAYIQSLSFDQVEKAASQIEQMAQCVPSILPLSRDTRGFGFSSAYGYRNDPFSGRPRFHRGMDITGEMGSNVYATGNGVVKEIGFSYSGYGRYVIVDHGFGYKTRYAHLREAKCYVGQHLSRGDVLGLLGRSGKSTGPHVHYEVIYMNKTVNPYYYFADIESQEYRALVTGAEKR